MVKRICAYLGAGCACTKICAALLVLDSFPMPAGTIRFAVGIGGGSSGRGESFEGRQGAFPGRRRKEWGRISPGGVSGGLRYILTPVPSPGT